MAAVWTGRLLVAWGGQAADGHQAAGEGAAYDPAADRWEALPPAPIPARFGASAVWTGREVLFWGGQAGTDSVFADGGAYDPVARRWRALPKAPIGARTSHQAVWTGTEMVVWGGFERCCPIDSMIHDQAAAAYDPATDQWRRIGDVPPPWSGDDGSAVTVAYAGRPLVWRHGRLAAYDAASNGWSEVAGVPPPPIPGNPAPPTTTADPFALAVSADHEILTWTGRSGELQGRAWGAADGRWRRTATLDAQSGASIAYGRPGQIYAAAGQAARVLEYRIADDRWEELPLPPVPTRSAASATRGRRWMGQPGGLRFEPMLPVVVRRDAHLRSVFISNPAPEVTTRRRKGNSGQTRPETSGRASTASSWPSPGGRADEATNRARNRCWRGRSTA
jgi:hypothetical protein